MLSIGLSLGPRSGTLLTRSCSCYMAADDEELIREGGPRFGVAAERLFGMVRARGDAAGVERHSCVARECTLLDRTSMSYHGTASSCSHAGIFGNCIAYCEGNSLSRIRAGR